MHRPGGHDRLVVEEHADPTPGPGELLVDVDAAAVNYADCVARMGLYASAQQYVGWPLTPGFDFAGRVAGGDGFERGERVLGVTRFGAYATRLAVPATQCFRPPDGWTVAECAALPTVYLTAWYALARLARPEPGALVLVHSAAGGVGGALLRLAANAGLRVVAVVGGAHKLDAARAAAGDALVAAIDRSSEPLWSAAERVAPGGYDAIFDANGGATLRASYAHLAPEGKLVVYGFHGMLPRRGGKPRWGRLALAWLRSPRFDPLRMTRENRSVLAFNLSFLFHRVDLLREAMGGLLADARAGRIAPPPVTTYPLDEVARAHADLESGATVGKLVLTMR